MLVAVLLIAGVAVRPSDAAAQSRPRAVDLYERQHAELRADLQDEVAEIVRFCEERGLSDAVAEMRAADEDAEPPPYRITFTPLARQRQPEIPRNLPEDERTWRLRWRRAEQQYARDLYVLARRAVRAGHYSYAIGLVREVTEHDPDHEAARRLFGWVRSGDEWVTPYERSMEADRHVWHDRFGWLKSTFVDRYEKGERYFDGRWIPAEREADLRRDFRNPWVVETEHYRVLTNHSLEEGVRIARALELYQDFFRQTFARFFETPEQLRKLFEGTTTRRRRAAETPPKHVVHFFRTKEDYVAALRARFPQIAITEGLYHSGDRVAYFYHDPQGENLPTIFHEATHQLFSEGNGHRPRDVGVRAHFWIVEGIACYMESFTREEGRLTVGDPTYLRFEAARWRHVEKNDRQPFAEISSLGVRQFQNGDQETLGARYSHASGWAHFFVHYDDGRYRDALVEHIGQLYDPRVRRAQTLPELTGVSAVELDRQYDAYVREQEKLVRRLERLAEKKAAEQDNSGAGDEASADDATTVLPLRRPPR